MDTMDITMVVPTSWEDITLGQYIEFMRTDELSSELAILCRTEKGIIMALSESDVVALKNMLDWIHDAPELNWQEVIKSLGDTMRQDPLDMTVAEFDSITEEPDLGSVSRILFQPGTDPMTAKMSDVFALAVRLGLQASYALHGKNGGDFSDPEN